MDEEFKKWALENSDSNLIQGPGALSALSGIGTNTIRKRSQDGNLAKMQDSDGPMMEFTPVMALANLSFHYKSRAVGKSEKLSIEREWGNANNNFKHYFTNDYVMKISLDENQIDYLTDASNFDARMIEGAVMLVPISRILKIIMFKLYKQAG